ncbi:SLC13 family permease [Prosthecochloris sp. N3]|uniref:SLC13 family permease n=1 Tax=Prosthecochloris ethylica TaxID=2743976 RepID=A0ABR9XU08_9CHLB|nr:SLC13 family permease [Prosthecochloris ethylica]MBF0587313.1 SLC13 family permease [Prosthecochloris ethylica]MBF0637449.1 SLC13 family permease [Prosthecochloris ethylica]NUK48607.1 SLC13 family permease [Prosthecochloris ethylica]
MLSFESLIVFSVILFIIISLYKTLMNPALTFIVGVLGLGVAGILEPREILAGFANEQIAVIVLLLLVGEVVRKTGVIDQIFDLFFRSSRTYRQFLFRMTAIVSGLSAFLNNTPLVAVMMPYVHNWSKGEGRPTPSKLLIPLSYASILGGCATLIGTSTNLIVNSMITEQQVIQGLRPLEMFEFAWVGVPMIVLGGMYLVVVSGRLLPENRDYFAEFKANTRQYLVETRLRPGAGLVGKSVNEAGLRNLQGLFLVKVLREGNGIAPVHPELKLRQDDILVFAGDTSTIADLLTAYQDLQPVEVELFGGNGAGMHVVEGVIAYNSSLENKTIKESQFRSQYDAAVVAVLRGGERISGKIGSISLKAGDVLLLLAGRDFQDLTRENRDFYVLSETRKPPKVETWKAVLPLVGLVSAIVLSTLKMVPLFLSVSVLLAVLLLFRVASAKDIVGGIDYNLVMIIAMSLALGVAMTKTGVAEVIASNMLLPMMMFGDIGVMIGVYGVTAVLGSLMLNKAAVALLFPVVLTLAQQTGMDPLGLILCMTFAAAANFLSPVGFQTNMMVYGPGGYSFKDFFRIGLPLTVMYMTVTVGVLSVMY